MNLWKTNVEIKFDLTKLTLSFNFPKMMKIKKLTKNACIPSKTYESDIGFDITITRKINHNYDPGVELYGTDISIELSKWTFGQLVARSSLCKSGYLFTNRVGIIDEKYSGDIGIILFQTSKKIPSLFDKLPMFAAQLIIRN